MSRSRVVLVVLFFLATVVPGIAADASTSLICTGYSACADKGYSHAGYATKKSTSYWRMYTGTNCTNYVAYRLVSTNGMANTRPAAGVGNARDWGTAMPSITDRKPAVGAVAWWNKTRSHVAYIERVVSPTEIWVSESNWNGAFDWRRITASGSDWPDGFIHFADPTIVNRSEPAITGTVKVGSPLTASEGSWSTRGNTYSYQWRASGRSIPGATTKTFTPGADQLHRTLTVRVTATSPGYPTARATSIGSPVAPGTLTVTSDPEVTGAAQVGSILAASVGSWDREPATFTYQWLANGVPVSRAIAPTYRVHSTKLGRQMSVAVTAAAPGYEPVTVTAAPTAAAIRGVFTVRTRAKVTGVARVGARLTASAGTWSPTGDFTYQWYSGDQPIAGATTSDHLLTRRDKGKKITVRITVRRPGFVTTTSRSAATAAVR